MRCVYDSYTGLHRPTTAQPERKHFALWELAKLHFLTLLTSRPDGLRSPTPTYCRPSTRYIYARTLRIHMDQALSMHASIIQTGPDTLLRPVLHLRSRRTSKHQPAIWKRLIMQHYPETYFYGNCLRNGTPTT